MNPELKFILAYEVSGPKFTCGQTIGADGSGSHARLISGCSLYNCLKLANEMREALERDYKQVKYVLVRNEEHFLGECIKEVQC
jgi:hypothetical protein